MRGALPGRQSIGLVTALDLFDQAGLDLERPCAEVQRCCGRAAGCWLRVSAYPWLRGAARLAFNTGRRWRLPSWCASWKPPGCRYERMTYANIAVGALDRGARLLQRWG